METLWYEREYFVELGNAHTLVYYPMIYYQIVGVNRVEIMYIRIFRWNNGFNGKYNTSKYYSNYSMG